MDTRNTVDGLRILLGASPTASSPPKPVGNQYALNASLLGTDRATLSSAGSMISETGPGSDVRTAKVAAIQAALIAGTYSIPASAVASKLVDSMLGNVNPRAN